ncbi:MAG TPA: hypothetical protein H9875_07305 [Candidatus Levilactobacillus faecigallinarum]|uniref:Uncharacterized protein n=1 Tax=Candidatus Levilactobacillus faecigallinarum TaxID=2838638 RepID=A0A9D1U559_9LACO|nr:hypothetical protein [Candidatus Levilactobacillus faecigallinarum]
MERKLCSIDIIQVGTKKTIEGLPKQVVLRLGGLELPITLNGLYALADGVETDDQREFIKKNIEMSSQLVKIISAIAEPYKEKN